ncbi:UMP-CMP kinase family protein [Planoprotostelium fungivorum]|uniref:UMP-CMP kinase n=1 Tax=Planoprotostelium fungivorum TaxID=1890364 RepID=A0A2P6NQQ2_9EUKA|nr:UMP-CMP kinase family protein [Planoprotostelium fungivorum]
MSKPLVVFVLGGPGAGKGTQSERIVNQFDFVHLSAGDLLRTEMNSGSSNGEMISSMIKEGKIVPSEVTVRLLETAMKKSDKNKFLIDGFPRNEENNQSWEREMGGKINFGFVLYFSVSEEELEKRLLNRGQTSGRSDDNIASIKKRFNTYKESTIPVIEYYAKQGKAVKINGEKPVEEVWEEVKKEFVTRDGSDARIVITPSPSLQSCSIMMMEDLASIDKCTLVCALQAAPCSPATGPITSAPRWERDMIDHRDAVSREASITRAQNALEQGKPMRFYVYLSDDHSIGSKHLSHLSSNGVRMSGWKLLMDHFAQRSRSTCELKQIFLSPSASCRKSQRCYDLKPFNNPSIPSPSQQEILDHRNNRSLALTDMGILSNHNTAVLPLTVADSATKIRIHAASRSSSRGSISGGKSSRSLFRRILSIRCISVTCAVFFIIAASIVITATGYITQQDLRQAQVSSQQQGVNLVSQKQLDRTLGVIEDTLTMLVAFLRTNPMSPNLNPLGYEFPHYTPLLNFMRQLASPSTFVSLGFTWVDGKSVGVSLDNGVWTVYENTQTLNYSVADHTIGFGTYSRWLITETSNLTTLNVSNPLFSIDAQAPQLPTTSCNLVFWTGAYYPSLPPVAMLCQARYLCSNDVDLIGLVSTCVSSISIQGMLSETLNDIGVPGGMAYIVDSNQNIIATSTGLFPYTGQGQPITTQNTNLTWVTSSYKAYIGNINGTSNVEYGGVSYRILGTPVTGHGAIGWTIILMLPISQDNYLRNSALICLAICIMASVLFFILILYLTKSLFHMSEELEKVSKLELDLNRLSEPPFLEASRLYKSFVMMHAALSSFSKYVPKEIIGHILKSRKEAIPYMSTANATIYFQDIKGFTSLAETVNPEVLADVTAEYMEAMTSIIIDHGGVIDKYIGDCIMALFNLPSDLKHHENAACQAATECTMHLKKLNKRWKKLYNFELNHRIGINSGEVLAGNIGSSQRLAFTCIGDNVNLASRVENVNKYYGTSVLITENTFSKIDKELFTYRKISTVQVEGKTRETSLYEITREKMGDKVQQFQMYEESLSLYDSNQLSAAERSLERLLEKYPGDQPAQHLMERVEKARKGEWVRVEMLAK